MKTSNKFLLAAAMVTVISMIVYDLLLRAEYRSGNYLDPYKNFTTLNYSGFDTLDLPSSTAANVKIVQGPFSVRMDKDATDFVQLKQEGRKLQINAGFEGNFWTTGREYILLISCPGLLAIHTNARYKANNVVVTDTIVREDWNMRQVLVVGFNQDSLWIIQDYGSTVVLANNQIRTIHARVGESPQSGSNLIIQDNNEFGKADLDIQNSSRLFLDNARIQDLNIQLGDKSKLIVTGKAKNLLTHIKPTQQ